MLFVFFFIGVSSFALELPPPGEFEIKTVENKDVLYVIHKKENGHISNTLIKLIQYYLINESDTYQVLFPQLSLESKEISGSIYAIGYKGNPKETKTVKTRTLSGGLFASYIYKGSYQTIGKAIRNTFLKVITTGKYIPHENEEIRLLYWNSIDDNHPKDLITEIQVRITKIR